MAISKKEEYPWMKTLEDAPRLTSSQYASYKKMIFKNNRIRKRREKLKKEEEAKKAFLAYQMEQKEVDI